MEDKRCEFVREDGTKCNGWKIKNNRFCFKHTQTPQERALTSQRGGLSGRLVTDGGKYIVIKKPRHIRRTLVQTLNLLKRGEIDPPTANAIGMLCGLCIKNFEIMEQEDRIAEIEKKLKLKKG